MAEYYPNEAKAAKKKYGKEPAASGDPFAFPMVMPPGVSWRRIGDAENGDYYRKTGGYPQEVPMSRWDPAIGGAPRLGNADDARAQQAAAAAGGGGGAAGAASAPVAVKAKAPPQDPNTPIPMPPQPPLPGQTPPPLTPNVAPYPGRMAINQPPVMVNQPQDVPMSTTGPGQNPTTPTAMAPKPAPAPGAGTMQAPPAMRQGMQNAPAAGGGGGAGGAGGAAPREVPIPTPPASTASTTVEKPKAPAQNPNFPMVTSRPGGPGVAQASPATGTGGAAVASTSGVPMTAWDVYQHHQQPGATGVNPKNTVGLSQNQMDLGRELGYFNYSTLGGGGAKPDPNLPMVSSMPLDKRPGAADARVQLSAENLPMTTTQPGAAGASGGGQAESEKTFRDRQDAKTGYRFRADQELAAAQTRRDAATRARMAPNIRESLDTNRAQGQEDRQFIGNQRQQEARTQLINRTPKLPDGKGAGFDPAKDQGQNYRARVQAAAGILRNTMASDAEKQKAWAILEGKDESEDGTPAPAPTAPATSYPKPSPDAIKSLQTNPRTKAQFEAAFGPGSAAPYVK